MRRILLPFWLTRDARRAWLLITVLIGAIFAEVALAIRLNAIDAVLQQAVLDKADATIVATLISFALLLVAVAANFALAGYFKQFVVIDWRRWLTRRATGRWLGGDDFYRIERDDRIDNADQRIAEDILLVTNLAVPMTYDLISKLAQIAGFAAILWMMGGPLDLAFVGIPLTVPGGMLWCALLVQGVGSAIVLALGYPLIRLTVSRQRKEADFRAALAGIRIHAGEVALYGGEPTEDGRLRGRFAAVVTNWHKIMGYRARVTTFTDFHNAFSGAASLWLAWPLYFTGRINYGEIYVIGAAFLRVSNGLNWIILWFTEGSLYDWAAAVRRLDAFDVELGRRDPSGIDVREVVGDRPALLETHALTLARPDGSPLTQVGDQAFRAGERWLVQGDSGTGKSTMARAMAGLWPYGSGTILRQRQAQLLFLPQKSYVPQGTLHAALCYPAMADRFDRAQCADVLKQVRLERLIASLDEEAPWQERLSPGEQQRLAFARVLLNRPDVLLLDEATSALDHATEAHVYTLIDDVLPDTAIISIAHSDSVAAFHGHRLRLRPAAGPEALA